MFFKKCSRMRKDNSSYTFLTCKTTKPESQGINVKELGFECPEISKTKLCLPMFETFSNWEKITII